MKTFKIIFLTLATALALTTPLCADTVVREKDGARETIEGTIITEGWDKIEIRTSSGKLSIKTDNVYSASRNISGLLAKAHGEAVAASTESAAGAAEGNLKKAAQNARKPWEREYAAWFRVRLWVDRGNIAKAVTAAADLEKANNKSRFLPEAWIDIAGMAFGAGDTAKINTAGTKLSPLGTLGRASANYFKALSILSKGDLKSGGDKMRLAFRQLQAQKSVAGRRLWVSAAWRYGQVLVEQKSTGAAREHLEAMKKEYETYDERGKGVTHCLEGDVLRLEKNEPDALYAYMRVVVQYPQYPDAHAHALDWAAGLSSKLKYTKDAKKLVEELKKKHGSYKRKATN